MVRKITKNPEELDGKRDYYDEDEGDFKRGEAVVVHCFDEEEARDVAKAVAEEVGIDE